MINYYFEIREIKSQQMLERSILVWYKKTTISNNRLESIVNLTLNIELKKLENCLISRKISRLNTALERKNK